MHKLLFMADQPVFSAKLRYGDNESRSKNMKSSRHDAAVTTNMSMSMSMSRSGNNRPLPRMSPDRTPTSSSSQSTRTIFDPVEDARRTTQDYHLTQQDAGEDQREPRMLGSSSQKELLETQKIKNPRPYRSHKYPACSRCHKRRSRCTIEVPGQACLLCRMSGIVCSAESNTTTDRITTRLDFTHRSTITDAEDNNLHVVGPVVARDTKILETLIPNIGDSVGSNSASSDPSGRPVYHTGIPPRRPDPPSCGCSTRTSNELSVQIAPIFDHLITLYFEELHPCLPIMDEQHMWTRLRQQSTLPKSFFLNFAAYIIFYWNLSAYLHVDTRPDQDAAWQAAVTSMNGDSQRNDLYTVMATVLNVAGRPSKGVIHNTGNVARITALAHSIGLNHNCNSWRLTQNEINTRSNLWWAVVIHDRWFNFAQGTPPYVNKDHYDVPVPSLPSLIAFRPNSVKHYRAAECYIQLCHLTEIVGDILPQIYQVRAGTVGSAVDRILTTEAELDQWLLNLPDWIHLDDIGTRPLIPGLPNLQLSYLAVRMLIRRLTWHEDCQGKDVIEYDLECLLSCQTIAIKVVQFVLSLKSEELAGFWLPYNAHHIASAVILLLRCAMQANTSEVRYSSFSTAKQLIQYLTTLMESSACDLAEMVLTECGATFKKFENAFLVLPMESDIDLAEPTQQPGNLNTPLHQNNSQFDNVMPFQLIDPNDQTSIEDSFPELFAEFTDSALFDEQFSLSDDT